MGIVSIKMAVGFKRILNTDMLRFKEGETNIISFIFTIFGVVIPHGQRVSCLGKAANIAIIFV